MNEQVNVPPLDVFPERNRPTSIPSAWRRLKGKLTYTDENVRVEVFQVGKLWYWSAVYEFSQKGRYSESFQSEQLAWKAAVRFVKARRWVAS